MRCLVVVVAVFCLLLSAADLRHSDAGRVPLVRAASLQAQPSRTELMQQSDHHRRVERAKKAEAETETDDPQIASFGMPEPASRDYDYLILILLAVSFVVFAFVARWGKRARSRL